ncbi:MAG: N-acetyltransferase [Cyanobacteria bacterium J06638_20]
MNVPLSDATPLACQIRAARISDVDALADLLVSSFHRQEGLAGLLYPFWRMALREDIRNRLRRRSPHYCCLVAVVPPSDTPEPATSAPRIIGTVEMSIRPQISLSLQTWFRAFPYLSNLAVMSTYRRHGIASRMIAACETTAKQWGYQDLYLHVLENNDAAVTLYQKLGFVTYRRELNPLAILLQQPQQTLLHKALLS